MTDATREQVYSGIPASGGVAIGHLIVLTPHDRMIRESGSVDEEHLLLKGAVETAGRELRVLISGEDELAGEILEFQLALLEDDDLLAPVFTLIDTGISADLAWRRILDGEIAEYRSGDDEYMSARADDLLDLKERVLRGLLDTHRPSQEEQAGGILIATNLTPSMFLEQNWQDLAGAAILDGSPTSHVAILARARDVSLLVGLDADLPHLQTGTAAVLDARSGRLICNPNPDTLDRARREIEQAIVESDAAESVLHEPARTRDGDAIRVMINVDDPNLLDDLSPDICDGIGLTRTEFLFEGKQAPGEDEQAATYRRILDWASARPVTIRTLDAGGDKPIPGITVDGESNPFLGVRGVRLSLINPDVFKTQIRALLRAAKFGPLKIMIPMVTVPEEMRQVRDIVEDARKELTVEGLEHGDPELGMMVEVPAAALTADTFDADFYSIGSNDLTQYTTAVSRDNAVLARLADSTNPAVMELISRTVDAGKTRNVEVSLCGDMASAPECIGALLDTGLKTVSVAPAAAGRVKLAISRYAGAGIEDERNR